MTKTIALAALTLCLAAAPSLAVASDSCTVQAAGKKLAGAAKTSFMTKCTKDATDDCDKQAADKNLKGAAKKSFTAKCVKDSTGT